MWPLGTHIIKYLLKVHSAYCCLKSRLECRVLHCLNQTETIHISPYLSLTNYFKKLLKIIGCVFVHITIHVRHNCRTKLASLSQNIGCVTLTE